jgi:hypothetical protein
MKRLLIVPALCLPLFAVSLGCGNSGPSGPRFENPNDPRIKKFERVGTGGVPKKEGGGGVSTPPAAKVVPQ